MKFRALLLILLLISKSHTVSAQQAPSITDSGLLWLVNADNRLAEDFVPPNLQKNQGFLMRPELIEPFNKMLEAMKIDGADGLNIQSAYRNYGHQSRLFSRKTSHYTGKGYSKAEAEAYAAQTVAYPGASEHQSGLALDVTVDGQLKQSFGETKQGTWLIANCHKFGFIIRYPQDKTEQTRIIYEPWHIRYVGVPHAAFMKEKNLCLEEYVEYLAENEKYIYWRDDVTYYLISSYGSKEEARAGAVLSSDRQSGEIRYITTEKKILTQ